MNLAMTLHIYIYIYIKEKYYFNVKNDLSRNFSIAINKI